MTVFLARFVSVFIGCLGVALGATDAIDCVDPNPLRFSLVPGTNPNKLLEEHRPLLVLLERHLNRKVEVIHPTSYGTVIEGLLSGTVDLASMGPAAYALAKNRDPSVTAFATMSMLGGAFIKPGANFYHSVLITLADSPVKNIADLRGHSVSLTDPASTSGAVIPRAEFGKRIHGRLEDYFDRVTFSGSHDRSIDALVKGYVDAVFVATEHLDTAIRQGRIKVSNIRVLWQSQPIPHDPFVYRGNLCASTKHRIYQAFMTDSPEIRRMLANRKGERFTPISDEDYRYIREILTNLQ